jgi:hypothetical protein
MKKKRKKHSYKHRKKKGIFKLQSPLIIKMSNVHVDMMKKNKRMRVYEKEIHKHANL